MSVSKPTSYWSMDETSSNSRLDANSVSQWDEVLGVGVPSTTTAKFGTRAAGPDFRAGYLQANSNGAVHPSGSFSLALWLNFASDLHQQAHILTAISSGNDRFWQWDHLDTVNDPARFRFIVRNSANTADTLHELSHVPTTDTWIFLAVKYDAAAQVIGMSLNGAPFGTTAHTGGLRTGKTFPTCIGKQSGEATSIIAGRGQIRKDHLAYWDGYALTDADISFLYNGGAGRAFPWVSNTGADGSLRAGGEAKVVGGPFFLML